MISSTLIDIRSIRSEANGAVASAMELNNQLDYLQYQIDQALRLTAPKDPVQEGIKQWHEDEWHKQAWQEWGYNSDEDHYSDTCHEDEEPYDDGYFNLSSDWEETARTDLIIDMMHELNKRGYQLLEAIPFDAEAYLKHSDLFSRVADPDITLDELNQICHDEDLECGLF